jgi:peptidoglycan/xylan/chitin deacetylase (PgdA/CDA1 family)
VLKEAISRFAYGTADRFGVNALLRRSRNDIAVLMYHGLAEDGAAVDAWTMVRAGEFRRQMQYVIQHCDLVTAQDLAAGGYAGVAAKRKPGRQQVMITFDDGYRSNYTIAFPILRELGLAATIFVATAFTGTQQMFWYDKVIHALQQSRCRDLNLRAHGLAEYTLPSGDAAQRWDAIQIVLTAIKTLTFDQREKLADAIGEILDVRFDDLPMFGALTNDDIAAMHRSGCMAFGSHTHRHEILTQSSLQLAEESIAVSKVRLEAVLGEPCRTFSYPNGNYNAELMALLSRMGVSLAFTTEKAFWNAHTDPRCIPRLGVGGYDSMSKFAALLSGLSH